MVLFAGPSKNKSVNAGLNVLTGGMSGAAGGLFNVAKGKKDPFELKALENLDPTKVRRADTSQTQHLIDRSVSQGDRLFAQNVERFNPQQITPMRGVTTSVGQVAGRGNFIDALSQAQNRANTAGQIDPRMQQFLEQSLGQVGNTNDALAMLKMAAQGGAPSAAQSVLQSGTDNAIASQLAAASSGGYNPAAIRGAQNQGAMLQQQAVNQGAMLRAQEMAQARQAYGQLGLSADQAQAQNFANAAGMQLNASQFQDQAKQNAMNALLSASQNLYGMDQSTAFQNANAANDMSQFNAANDLSAQQFEQQQQQAALNAYNAAMQGYAGLGSSLYGQALGGQQGLTSLDQARLNQSGALRGQVFGGGMSAGGNLAAVAMSDRKQKKNISVNKSTQQFLNALTDYEYEYRDTSLPGTQSGKNYGPMAQDLEKSDMGKTIVKQTANGKMVDTSRGFLLALSGLANLNSRLSALETT